MTGEPVLLLSPSSGFGGGIERVVDAIEHAYDGSTRRVDLYVAGREPEPAGNRAAKARFAAAAMRAAARRDCRAIVCLHAGLLPVATAAGALRHRPVALIAYGTEVWGPMGRLHMMQIRACKHLIAISRYTAYWLARRADVPEPRISVLPLPIGAELARLALQEAPAHHEPTVLTVSRLTAGHRYKGHFAIADTWPLILAEVPEARWKVIGDGDDLEALQARCAGIPSVEFAGRVSDEALAAAYRSASLLALPSVADPQADPPVGEGFGLVYAEAGAFGLPAVASTRGGGASEFVEDGVTGLTVPPHDRSRLAAAIVELLADAALRNRLGAAARERTLELHWPDGFRQRLERLLA